MTMRTKYISKVGDPFLLSIPLAKLRLAKNFMKTLRSENKKNNLLTQKPPTLMVL